jgi:hypothetical protein
VTTQSLRRVSAEMLGAIARGYFLPAVMPAMPASTKSEPNGKRSSLVAGLSRRRQIIIMRGALSAGEPTPLGNQSSAHVTQGSCDPRWRATRATVRRPLRRCGDRFPAGRALPAELEEVLSSRRGRAPPPTPLATIPPRGEGDRTCPSSALNFFTRVILTATDPPCHDPHSGVMPSARLKIRRAEPRLSGVPRPPQGARLNVRSGLSPAGDDELPIRS